MAAVLILSSTRYAGGESSITNRLSKDAPLMFFTLIANWFAV